MTKPRLTAEEHTDLGQTLPGRLMTVTEQLAAFLRERLAEDEQAARGALSFGTAHIPPDTPDSIYGSGQSRPYLHVVSGVAEYSAHIARHFARWDPARVHDEVEAKRLLVDAHGLPHRCIGDTGPCHVLRCLALPYREHPDFRPEWAPDS